MESDTYTDLGLWGDSLAAPQREPKQLLKVNPETSAIEKKISLSRSARPILHMISSRIGQRWFSGSLKPEEISHLSSISNDFPANSDG